MVKPRFLIETAAGLMVLFASAGCPLAPSYQPALLVSPENLDFGTSTDSLTFSVWKVWTSKPMPPFVAAANQLWVSLDPATGVSDGPWDPVVVTVAVDRHQLLAGENTAQISITASGLVSKTVQVRAVLALVADFTAESIVGFVGEPVQFYDLSYEVLPAKEILSWQWDFGDGSAGPERFNQHPAHIYQSPGSYTVSLTVSTGETSHTRVETNYITVFEKTAPVADFIAIPTEVVSGQLVSFLDRSVAGSARIETWQWNFGDGTTGPERFLQNPTHRYTATVLTQFPVSLSVTSAHGGDTEVKQNYITVTPAP